MVQMVSISKQNNQKVSSFFLLCSLNNNRTTGIQWAATKKVQSSTAALHCVLMTKKVCAGRCTENRRCICDWFTACAPWLMTDLCQTSGLMNEWKARKKEPCEIQAKAETQREGGNSRIHFSQPERQTKAKEPDKKHHRDARGALRHRNTTPHTPVYHHVSAQCYCC